MTMASRKWPDLHYAQVAEVYLEAMEDDGSPVQAVAQTWDVVHSTAARWAKRARELGYLSPVSGKGSRSGLRCKGRCSVCCEQVD